MKFLGNTGSSSGQRWDGDGWKAQLQTDLDETAHILKIHIGSVEMKFYGAHTTPARFVASVEAELESVYTTLSKVFG